LRPRRPYPFDQIDLNNVLHAPTLSGHHIMGTDEIGQDEFSRIIYGIRTSAEVGLFVAVVSTIIGLLLGAIAGYFGGWFDNLLMRFTDLVLTLPVLAILLTAAALLGQGSQWRISIILALLLWTTTARVIRGVFLSLREKEYVEAAKAAGGGDLRIMFRHILPNTLGPIVVTATLAVAAAILIEARSRSSASASSPRHPRSASSSRRARTTAEVVADRLPGRDDRDHRPRHQLRRGRSPRRARPQQRRVRA
jgi:ABC-type dipeptide/oligopeptide/nickel transport systems, permease components